MDCPPKKVPVVRAVIRGRNPEHLLQLSSLDVMGDKSGKLKVTV